MSEINPLYGPYFFTIAFLFKYKYDINSGDCITKK